MAIGAILGIIQYVPLVIKVVGEAIEAIEELGGPKTGDAKKAALLDAFDAAFDLQQAVAPGALELDKAQFHALCGHLAESALTLQKARAEQSGKLLS